MAERHICDAHLSRNVTSRKRGMMSTAIRLSYFFSSASRCLTSVVELFSLLRDTIRVALLILGARECRGLLDQLPDIVAQQWRCDPRFRGAKAYYRWSLCFSLVDG